MNNVNTFKLKAYEKIPTINDVKCILCWEPDGSAQL